MQPWAAAERPFVRAEEVPVRPAAVRPILAACALATLSATVRPASAATRSLRLELAADPANRFSIENLAGTMRVVAGPGERVEVSATVHAESEELASAVRLERVTGDQDEPTLRVRYPLHHSTFRYGSGHGAAGEMRWWELLFAGGSDVKYDGRRVRVSPSRGVMVYADVEVRLPRRSVHGRFRNAVGPMSGEGVEGRLLFDTGSGAVTLRDVKGDVVADTGSGNVSASTVAGAFRCDTGSGNCEVRQFSGQDLACDTGSGEVLLSDLRARRVAANTGSGDVKVTQADLEEFAADTGSGNVVLETRGGRLSRVKADTGSGDVRLRLGPHATFEVRADTGSGDVVSRYADAQPILRRRTVIGYRRGDGRIAVAVDTGSGDVVVEP
jgi:hypothetical protein